MTKALLLAAAATLLPASAWAQQSEYRVLSTGTDIGALDAEVATALREARAVV